MAESTRCDRVRSMNARMMMAVIGLVTWACSTTPQPSMGTVSRSPAGTPEDARFTALLEEEWEWGLREHPVFATFLGDLRYNDRLSDQSLEAIARRKQHTRELHARLKEIDPARLSE